MMNLKFLNDKTNLQDLNKIRIPPYFLDQLKEGVPDWLPQKDRLSDLHKALMLKKSSGIVVAGEPVCGKTTLACVLALKYFEENGLDVFFIRTFDLVRLVRAGAEFNDSTTYYDFLTKDGRSLLVIDGFFAPEREDADLLYDIIQKRMFYNKRTILTSVPLDQVKAKTNASFYGLLEEHFLTVVCERQ